jgi:hypothetical protein
VIVAGVDEWLGAAVRYWGPPAASSAAVTTALPIPRTLRGTGLFFPAAQSPTIRVQGSREAE